MQVKGQPGALAVYGYKGTFNIQSKDNNKFGVEFEGKIYPKLLAWLTILYTIITIQIFFSYPLPGFLLLLMGIFLSILSFIERKKPKKTIVNVMAELTKEFD